MENQYQPSQNQTEDEPIKQEKPKRAMPENLKILLVMILAFILIGGFFYILFGGEIPKISGPGSSPEESTGPPGPGRLSNCQELSSSCIDKSCQYFSLCQEEGEFKECQVYDCGENYGLVITKKEGETPNKIIKTLPKGRKTITSEEIKDIRQRCEGKVEILEQSCENGKLNLKVKVETKGECKIQSFIAKIDTEYQIFKFDPSPLAKDKGFEKTDDFYNLTLSSCPEEFEVIAVGEEGISIE